MIIPDQFHLMVRLVPLLLCRRQTWRYGRYHISTSSRPGTKVLLVNLSTWQTLSKLCKEFHKMHLSLEMTWHISLKHVSPLNDLWWLSRRNQVVAEKFRLGNHTRCLQFFGAVNSLLRLWGLCCIPSLAQGAGKLDEILGMMCESCQKRFQSQQSFIKFTR